MAAIARAGVLSTPGVSVDGRLVHAGGLPDATKLEGWLRADPRRLTPCWRRAPDPAAAGPRAKGKWQSTAGRA
jgi:hypothetical protein